jgi:hypothetical protein
MATVLAIENERKRAWMLSELAPHLPSAERVEAISRAFDAALAICTWL